MAKIVGFNQGVADAKLAEKKTNQRAASLKHAGTDIHFRKGFTLPNPVLTERIRV